MAALAAVRWEVGVRAEGLVELAAAQEEGLVGRRLAQTAARRAAMAPLVVAVLEVVGRAAMLVG